MRIRDVVRSLDWLMVAPMVLLSITSLAMLFSATYTTASIISGRFGRQLIALVVSWIVFILVARVPYHVFRRYTWFFYVGGLGGLGIVALTARIIRGAASRLAIFGFQIQPSEFIKIALIMALAYVFSSRRGLTIRSFWVSCFILGVPVLLISLEPDLGVASLSIALWGIVLIFLGLPWKAVITLGLSGIAAISAAWRWLLLDYQKNRILTFLNPNRDPLGAGYNVVQSIVAFGSGKLFGRGLGHGPQSQLQFLPERHTDFILASIGEELGFIGIAVVIILYGVLLWRIIETARLTRDTFGQILCVGAFGILSISFLISAGMNMGLLPVTGIPLPLVSYGGSNVLATMIVLGLVQSVRLHSKWTQKPPSEISHIL